MLGAGRGERGGGGVEHGMRIGVGGRRAVCKGGHLCLQRGRDRRGLRGAGRGGPRGLGIGHGGAEGSCLDQSHARSSPLGPAPLRLPAPPPRHFPRRRPPVHRSLHRPRPRRLCHRPRRRRPRRRCPAQCVSSVPPGPADIHQSPRTICAPTPPSPS